MMVFVFNKKIINQIDRKSRLKIENVHGKEMTISKGNNVRKLNESISEKW